MTDEQNNPKVLMIDDEMDIVSFFQSAFQNFKHIEFRTSQKPTEGIEIAREYKPTVVMIDLRMPEMNGEDAIVEMKSFLPDTKFVVMTGWQDGELRDKLENEIGVAAYYEKPVDLEKVITKVMSLIMLKN